VRLLDDPALRHRLGACARERAEREFPIERRRGEITAIMERLLG
jgi:glycosyltransferase involved in cell wall biosynthesis